MAPSYHIAEPHPSFASSAIYFGGRGGAGNARTAPSNITSGPNARGPASRCTLTTPSTANYYSYGRGGAGNLQKERAMFSFDEELALQERRRENAAPVYTIGRGGLGNVVDEMKPRTTRTGSTSSVISDSSADDERGVRRSIEGAWQKVRQYSFSRA